jgi:hypothetical protein
MNKRKEVVANELAMYLDLWSDPPPGVTGMATENVKRAVAMNNRQCLNRMADYLCFCKGSLV